MREAFVLATCDKGRCSSSWQAEVDAPPVVVTLPDGTKIELDLCPSHIQQLKTDWLRFGHGATLAPVAEVTARPTVEKKATAPKKRRRRRRIPPSEREKVTCPVAGCESYGTSAPSLQSHIRKAHDLPSAQVSDMVSQLFGTRRARRTPCPECGESQAVHFLSRHRRKEHGVAA